MVFKDRSGRELGKLGREQESLARTAASALTLLSISCASLGLWRLGTDLDLAGRFVVRQGFFSHWQVWIGAAAGAQYAGWRLSRKAQQPRPAEALFEPGKEAPSPAPVPANV